MAVLIHDIAKIDMSKSKWIPRENREPRLKDIQKETIKQLSKKPSNVGYLTFKNK